MKSEMDKRLSDLVNFSKSFKLNKPIPEDLVPILAKDEGKQKAIKEKSTRDAEDARARAIGVSSTLTAPGARPVAAGSKGGADTARAAAVKSSGTSGTGNTMHKTATVPSKPGEQAKKISMVIQPIPPFKGRRSTTTPAAPVPQQAGAASVIANGAPKPAASPLSPTAQNRLNVNASSFRPNVNVKPFSPVCSVSNFTRVDRPNDMCVGWFSQPQRCFSIVDREAIRERVASRPSQPLLRYTGHQEDAPSARQGRFQSVQASQGHRGCPSRCVCCSCPYRSLSLGC